MADQTKGPPRAGSRPRLRRARGGDRLPDHPPPRDGRCERARARERAAGRVRLHHAARSRSGRCRRQRGGGGLGHQRRAEPCRSLRESAAVRQGLAQTASRGGITRWPSLPCHTSAGLEIAAW